jgi:hypothetical protein
MASERHTGVADLARRVDAPVEVVAHPHCRGHRWAVNPGSRTIYYREDLPAGDAADAVIDAVAALRTHDGRATLRLVQAAG